MYNNYSNTAVYGCNFTNTGGKGDVRALQNCPGRRRRRDYRKKSRFIATVRLVESEEEALAFIEEMRKKYWDARHNCYAYSVGVNREFTRCSDDGEPSGTAGRPMLDVILGRIFIMWLL